MNQSKQIVFFIILFSGVFKMCTAQVAFRKAYGGVDYDYGYSVTQTFDKGYAVTGSTTSFGNGNSDAYILKTDSLGVALWHKTFGGINVDQAYSIKETSDSGLVIAGFTNSTGNGGYDMYIIKTDRSGNTQWQKTLGGSNWDFAYSIDQTMDGGFIIAGGTYSFGKGNEDIYLVKTDANGDTLWTKTFGEIDEDEARSVKQTSDGGYIITGFSKSFGDSDGDIYAVKTDASGDSAWTFKYNGGKEDRANDVIENSYGGFIIGGKSKLFTGNNFNGIVINISATGFLTSIDTSMGGNNNDDFIASIKQVTGGRFAVAGTTFSYGWGQGDFILHITNPYNGWHGPTMGDTKNETLYSLGNTKDGGYILCGSSNSYSTLDHIFLVKTDSNGLSPLTVNSIILGMNERITKNSLIKVYPIPSSNELFIDVIAQHDKQTIIYLIDILGREIFQEELNTPDNRYKINTSGIPDGIYFVTIQNKNFTSTERIIIQH